MGLAWWRLGAKFLLDVPKNRLPPRRAGKVRARFIDDSDSKSFRLSLSRTDHIGVYAISLTIPIRVELRFNPQSLTNPLLRICKGRNDLRLAIHEDWLGGSTLRDYQADLQCNNVNCNDSERPQHGHHELIIEDSATG